MLTLHEQVKDDPTRFAGYAQDPLGFIRDVLGVTLWSKQQDVVRGINDHRRVAVRSGHGTGKTLVVACVVLWWLYAVQGLVISTAPTWEHVESVLWREIHERRKRALAYLPGEDNMTELRIDKTWYAKGLSTAKPSAFQGRHHARLLVVIDEAPGVAELAHTEIATLTTGGSMNKILMIGNPTETAGTFYEAFKHPNIWHLISISCLEHPNVIQGKEVIPGAVTREWVEERRMMWGTNHPFWYSRVLGEFPKISTKGVIPLGWVERAQNNEERKKASEAAKSARIPRVGGLDVARYGDNLSVLAIRRGDAIEKIFSWQGSTLTETAQRALRIIDEEDLKLLVVDASGIGAGVCDILIDSGANILGYNGGHRAFTSGSFANRRSEMWWYLRQRLEKKRLWLPEQGVDQLIADLVAPSYHVSPAGRIQVESKEKMIDAGIKSPDFADALVLCFAMDEDPEAELKQGPAERQDPLAFEAPEALLPIEDEHDAFFRQLPGGF